MVLGVIIYAVCQSADRQNVRVTIGVCQCSESEPVVNILFDFVLFRVAYRDFVDHMAAYLNTRSTKLQEISPRDMNQALSGLHSRRPLNFCFSHENHSSVGSLLRHNLPAQGSSSPISVFCRPNSSTRAWHHRCSETSCFMKF